MNNNRLTCVNTNVTVDMEAQNFLITLVIVSNDGKARTVMACFLMPVCSGVDEYNTLLGNKSALSLECFELPSTLSQKQDVCLIKKLTRSTMSNIIQAHFVQSTELDYETLEMINFICMITDWTFNESNYFRCKMKERAEIMPDGSERIRSICVEMGYMPDYFQSCTSVYYDKTENQSKIKGE